MNTLKHMASAYVFVYGVLYIGAAMLGTGFTGIPYQIAFLILIVMGLVCWSALALKLRLWRTVLCFLWGFAAMASWMRIVPWTPPYSEVQYTVMALMNMGQAVSMAVLGEVWRLE